MDLIIDGFSIYVAHVWSKSDAIKIQGFPNNNSYISLTKITIFYNVFTETLRHLRIIQSSKPVSLSNVNVILAHK